MTTLALLDVPACLDLATFSVAPPASLTREIEHEIEHETEHGIEHGIEHETEHRPASWDYARPSPGGTQAFRDGVVRECVDTVSLLRAYREPLPHETWERPKASERRLLAQVNAILALGSRALGQVVDLAVDNDLPNPGRVFASLFVLGCVSGTAWRLPMRRLFVEAVQRHPNEAAAAIEALGLAPNPDLVPSIAELLDDPRHRVRAASVRVLSFRAALGAAAWSRAMRDEDPSVQVAAACAPLGGYPRDECERALASLPDNSEWCVRASLMAGFSLRLMSAHRQACEISRQDPAWADALVCVGMFGHGSEEGLVRDALQGPQWRVAARAAGLLGRVGLMPDLLALTARAGISPDDIEQIALAATHMTGLPFGTGSEPADMRRSWSQNAARFDPRERYRQGMRFHPGVLVQALRVAPDAGWRSHMRDVRQQAYLELAAATDWQVGRFSAYDFVAVQETSIRRIAQRYGGSQHHERASGA